MKKILIVEDELPSAELEKDYLELSDFEGTIETDGIEGEAKAMSGEYDLLILDVMLPGQDGFEICRKYREKYLAPVIVVSAKKEDIDKIHGLGLGADDYMTKPFSPSELVARVKAHINRYESLTEKSSEKTAKNETIEVGDLKIDRTARRVFVRGEEKNLTSKEFALLFGKKSKSCIPERRAVPANLGCRSDWGKWHGWRYCHRYRAYQKNS